MAYAAVISLKQTIEGFLDSGHISIQERLRSAYHWVEPLQKIVERLDNGSRYRRDSMRYDAAAAQVREAAYKLEDVLETQPDGDGDMEVMQHEINSFIQMVKKMELEYHRSHLVNERYKEMGEEEDRIASSGIDCVRGKSSSMIGFDDEYSRLVEKTRYDKWSTGRRIVSLVGMAGIGKTALVMKLVEDPRIKRNFQCGVYVNMGPKCTERRIIHSIWSQLLHPPKLRISHDTRAEQVRFLLAKTRYLLVLDDLWDSSIWIYLKDYLPDGRDGSRILVTTRLEQVAEYVEIGSAHRVRFLNKEESWNLLCQKVFGEGQSCPFHLEKVGRKIADLCDGLPLAIVTVGGIIAKAADNSEEYWEKVAERRNSVFMEAEEEMSKVLFPSYNYLPLHVKPCFLYMGIFPEKCEIRASKLVNLWSAEGLLAYDLSVSLEQLSMNIFKTLISQSLITSGKASSRGKGRIKTCRLHFAFRYLCLKEAGANKFMHAIGSHRDTLGDGIKNQRRLCVLNNVVFRIREMYRSMNSIATVRSLLCTGPYHPYSVRICSELRLLRVLDVLTIRFYEFPEEVVDLVPLRYLALTCNQKLPPSISKLVNLQYLIVCRHLSITDTSAPMRLPVEIWDMKELKHIHFEGGEMPEPISDAFLQNLTSLSGVSAYSCTQEILSKIPNLEKLGIRIELSPDATDNMHWFEHISCLDRLNSLKCIVANPNLLSKVVPMATPAPICIFIPMPWYCAPSPAPIFTPGLKKLTLSGLGYPWKAMDAIALLPRLTVLKLQRYAFKGPKWTVAKNTFTKLRHFQIEETDLTLWGVKVGSFRILERLIIRHCYKLKQIPEELVSKCAPHGKVEILDCNPLVMYWAKRERIFYSQFLVHFSGDD